MYISQRQNVFIFAHRLYLCAFLMKGIKSRIYETFVVLILLLILVSSFVWVFSAFMSRGRDGWFASVSGSYVKIDSKTTIF